MALPFVEPEPVKGGRDTPGALLGDSGAPEARKGELSVSRWEEESGARVMGKQQQKR